MIKPFLSVLYYDLILYHQLE
uniref:Uncharacterized protein n=1 Tax=Rhizophora mucronata TaxID=61149 RepID=A0A2P2N9T7_RHIMU